MDLPLLVILTNVAEVIPIRNRQPTELIPALKNQYFSQWVNLSSYIHIENQVLEQKCPLNS